jgi:hypothetical protein
VIEQLRIDEANEIFGFRLNTWTSLLAIVLALMVFRNLKAKSQTE